VHYNAALLSTEQEEDEQSLDGGYYGIQQGQQPAGSGERQAEDESGNQPWPEDHNHGNAALVRETGTCVRSAATGSAGRFGLESWRLMQIEVRTVRAGPGDGDRRRRNCWR